MKLKHKMIFSYHPDKMLNWDELRKSKENISYWIPDDKNKYLSQRELNYKDRERINFLKSYIRNNNLTQIFSIGSGRANFEYYLKKSTKISTIISDYSDTIKKIEKFKIFDDIKIIDAKKKFRIKNANKTLVILPRIDTEFSDGELTNLIQNLHDNEVDHIYFIVGQLLTIKTFFIELKIRILAILKRKKLIYCGVSRSKSEFKSLFLKYYKIKTYDNYKSFILTKK